jgi:hypothetical protein
MFLGIDMSIMNKLRGFRTVLNLGTLLDARVGVHFSMIESLTIEI